MNQRSSPQKELGPAPGKKDIVCKQTPGEVTLARRKRGTECPSVVMAHFLSKSTVKPRKIRSFYPVSREFTENKVPFLSRAQGHRAQQCGEGGAGGGLVHEPGGLYPKSTCISPALKTGGGGGGAQY